MRAERLTSVHEEAIVEALLRDPLQNLFLLGFADQHGLDHAAWYGVLDGETVRSLVMLIPGRLLVPWIPFLEDAQALAAVVRARHAPCMTVGPRAACDAIWERWARGVEPDRFYDQRLYLCDDPPPGPSVAGFRRGNVAEWRAIAHNSGKMEEEDLGVNPYDVDPRAHERVVRGRLTDGRTWVIERQGSVLFQVNVGTTTAWGCQVGGTYVPVPFRGRGYARAGMSELCRRLVPRHGRVALHVNEANTPAVAVYEKTGFVASAPFRLITVRH